MSVFRELSSGDKAMKHYEKVCGILCDAAGIWTI
jgi:hypothetical protein